MFFNEKLKVIVYISLCYWQGLHLHCLTCIKFSGERFAVFPRQRWTIPAMMMRRSARTFVMEKISVTLAANLTLEQLIAVRKPERRKWKPVLSGEFPHRWGWPLWVWRRLQAGRTPGRRARGCSWRRWGQWWRCRPAWWRGGQPRDRGRPGGDRRRIWCRRSHPQTWEQIGEPSLVNMPWDTVL